MVSYSRSFHIYSIIPIVIVVYDHEDTIAIFPFGLHEYYGVKVVKFLGGGQSDYNNPIVSSETSFEDYKSIWEKVLNEILNYDVLDLQRIPLNVKDGINLFENVVGAKTSGMSYSMKLPNC